VLGDVKNHYYLQSMFFSGDDEDFLENLSFYQIFNKAFLVYKI